MPDISYSSFQHYGTAAQRAAFTPDPPADRQPIYIWYETDTGLIYIFTTAWTLVGGSGTLLTHIAYNPVVATDVSTSSTTGADVDAANLKITFTAPASGAVRYVLKAGAYNATSGGYWWTLRDTSGNNIANTRARVAGGTLNNHIATCHIAYETGLTPGTSYTRRWGHGVVAGAVVGHIRYGEDGTADPFGPAIMEAWAA
jgi:hypothetical protein